MKKFITISVKDCKYFEEVEDYDGNCTSPDGIGKCCPDKCLIHKEDV